MARIIGLELGSRTVRAVVLDGNMRRYEIVGGAIVPILDAPPPAQRADEEQLAAASVLSETGAGGEGEGEGLGELIEPNFGRSAAGASEGEAAPGGDEPYRLGAEGAAPEVGEEARPEASEAAAPAAAEGPGDEVAAAAEAAAQEPGAEEGDTLAEGFDPLRHALGLLAEKIGGFKADLIAVALPGAQTSTPFITLPFSEPKKIDATLGFEVEGLLPFELEEALYDYQLISQKEGKSELVVGIAREEEVRALLDQIAAAGVDPRIVTLPGLANLTLLQELLSKDPLGAEETEGLLDLGEERAILTIVRGRAEARQGPKLVYMRVLRGLEKDAEGPALLGLVRELRQSLFAAQTRDRHPMRRLRLVGDHAATEGLAERLERDLGVAVEAEEALPAEGGEKLPAAAHGALAQAFGLALRGQVRSSRLLNLRKGPLAFRGDHDYLKGKVSRLVAMAATIAVLIGASIWTHASTLKRQEDALDEALCQMTQRAIGSCETDFNIALAKLQGGDNKASQIPTASAMDVFAAAIDHVPSSIGLRVDEIDATLDRLRIRGEVDSFDAVDQVIAELRKANCIGDVRPGRIQKNREEKIEFTLDALYVCGQNAGNAG